MKKRHLLLLLAAALLTGGTNAGAQPQGVKVTSTSMVPEFIPGEVEIFSDGLNGARLGGMPANWQLIRAAGDKQTTAEVRELHGLKALVMTRSGGGGVFQPLLPAGTKLGNDFTLEYEVYQDEKTCSTGCGTSIILEDGTAAGVNEQRLTLWLGGKVSFFCRRFNTVSQRYEYASKSGQYAGTFDKDAWHHVALSFRSGQTRFYVDNQLVLSTGGCFTPSRLLLGGRAVFGMRNVQLAVNPPGGPFSRLEAGNRLMARAIRFEVDGAKINPEGMAYLRELAEWLKGHPDVFLQINGHADYEGSPTHNVQLSLDRALSVRAQLITFGIRGDRLVAKGFGTTVLADTSPTAEGRARNRRVELVKL